jgi:hypothetical protein
MCLFVLLAYHMEEGSRIESAGWRGGEEWRREWAARYQQHAPTQPHRVNLRPKSLSQSPQQTRHAELLQIKNTASQYLGLQGFTSQVTEAPSRAPIIQGGGALEDEEGGKGVCVCVVGGWGGGERSRYVKGGAATYRQQAFPQQARRNPYPAPLR